MIISFNFSYRQIGCKLPLIQTKLSDGNRNYFRLLMLLLICGPSLVFGQDQRSLNQIQEIPDLEIDPDAAEGDKANKVIGTKLLPDNDTLPAPDDLDVVEAEFVLAANSPELFTLAGTTRDAYTNEIVKGVKLEVHQLSDTGAKQLVFTGAFYRGDISVVLRRGQIYQVKVSRQDYLSQVINLLPRDVQSKEVVIERDFILRKKERDQAGREKDLALTMAEKNIAGEQYLITTATSLRRDADSRSKVILRLQPGDRVEMLETTDQWWWKIRFKGKTGYAKALLMQQESE